ncbi:MAG: AAA family ATPase, partial [Clostridia bacterium]|nr:AAA family ATPase [Clostridia bacterium]
MLQSLYIENVAVARRVNVEFHPGFTVITGETGAGKSVMIDCLGLITGGRAGREMIRSGAERAVVSA